MPSKKIEVKERFGRLSFDGKWSFAHDKYEVYSHNYHRYPAKFIGPLAKRLIEEECNEKDIVCDPFGGCGTTLVEAKINGRESFGFDINPVAKLITEVKVKPINPDTLIDAQDRLVRRMEDSQAVGSDYYKATERIQYWFSKGSYDALSHIHSAILEEEKPDIQKFFICALSHCLKNASRWLMKSIKPTIDSNKQEIDVFKTFINHLNRMVKKNEIFYHYLKAEKRLSLASNIYLQDITKKNHSKLKADLIITSPPYVTSYEYGDLHQLTLLWLGHKKYKNWGTHIRDFRSFKSYFIGSSLRIDDFIGSSLCIDNQAAHRLGSDIALNIVKQMEQSNKALSRKINTYFLRMNKAFRSIHRLLRKDKKACIIIGNTNLLGVSILNAQVALEQLLNLGFDLDDVIKRDANTRKMIAPYRDKDTGKFTSKTTRGKVLAYHEEYILKVKKK